jgi:integrase
MTRRRPGRGSIFQDKASGKWKFEYDLPPEGGERKRARLSFPTRAMAVARSREIAFSESTRTQPPVASESLRDFGDWWLENVKRDRVRPGVLGDYAYRLQHWVYPELGDMQITDITSDAVLRWMRKLREQGLSVSTVNGARRQLHMVMSYAASTGRLSVNPVAASPSFPRQPTSVVREPWSVDEARNAIRSLNGDPLELYVLLCLVLGLRRGEALGLHWKDVDLGKFELAVRATLSVVREQDEGGTWHTRNRLGPPKTRSSERTLFLDDYMIGVFRRHQERQEEQRRRAGDLWQEEGLVFTSNVGSTVSISNVRKGYIKALERAELRFIRVHDLRHSMASLALEFEVDISALSQSMGHSDISVTKGTYAPNVPALNRRLAERVGAGLFRPSDGDIEGELERAKWLRPRGEHTDA